MYIRTILDVLILGCEPLHRLRRHAILDIFEQLEKAAVQYTNILNELSIRCSSSVFSQRSIAQGFLMSLRIKIIFDVIENITHTYWGNNKSVVCFFYILKYVYMYILRYSLMLFISNSRNKYFSNKTK